MRVVNAPDATKRRRRPNAKAIGMPDSDRRPDDHADEEHQEVGNCPSEANSGRAFQAVEGDRDERHDAEREG